MVDDEELIHKATIIIDPRRLSPTVEVGSVGSALVTDKGNIYIAVCIDTASSLGFCAEINAIGNMVTHGESKIVSIVAVKWNGKVLAPCGKCREFMYQVNIDNAGTRVLLSDGKVMKLNELLPEFLVEDVE
jgi:cytidine deaminase